MGCEASVDGQVVFPIQTENKDMKPICLADQIKELEVKAYQLFKTSKFAQAAQIYKQIIEKDPITDYQIVGLGNVDQDLGYYEWNIYEWYSQNVLNGTFKINPYDCLSLTLSKSKVIKDGIKWYQKMLVEHPLNYQLIHGYGNALRNELIFDQAINQFTKVIEMKPEFIMSYVCLAFIYEYRRIEKVKSINWCNKILEKEGKNMYALFMLARNEKDIEVRIQKLKEASQLYPKYSRILNQIGICYGANLKNYSQAIQWYKKVVIVTPKYSSAYNNIGVNYELMNNYDQAKKWYYKGCQMQHDYKSPHTNLTDIYDALSASDDEIIAESKKYNLIEQSFYYYIGLSYYDKKKTQKSIEWYNRVLALNKTKAEIYNSLGISYDQLGQYDMAIQNYGKSTELNPAYFSAYYNIAIVYKNKNQIDNAIIWYKKAIQVNPRYSFAYNNLGNIYKNRGQYEEAIKNYKNAVDNLSTYTLAIVNAAVCHLKLQHYKQAFELFTRAEDVLPTDNNNLNQSNKTFLKQNLDKFKAQGKKWKMNGSITSQMKIQLDSLILAFQNKFKSLLVSNNAVKLSNDIVLKKEVLNIIKIVHEDKFQLSRMKEIFNQIQTLFHQNQEYFHFVPQLFIQYFFNKHFESKVNILQIQEYIKTLIRAESYRISNQKKEQPKAQTINAPIQLKNFILSNNCSVNLFKDIAYFSNYQQLFSQIDKVNRLSKLSLIDFKELVSIVSEKSGGKIMGVGMKMPDNSNQKFKVILRILQKMFKKQINQERVKSIINKISLQLKTLFHITLVTVVSVIVKIWNQQITAILKGRNQNNIETVCTISDLVRGKCMFERVQQIAKAVSVIDDICKSKGYNIIELDNRLSKPETMDVVLKIQINDAVCEFQLALKQDQGQYHYIHSVYEIERSPLGVIFGSYLYMSKGFKYPFNNHCKDIVQRLKDSMKEDDRKVQAAASYIIETMKQKSSELFVKNSVHLIMNNIQSILNIQP